MSIFPKRTLAGAAVTIHWNFNTSELRKKHIYPLVRIGVRSPDGHIAMLLEKHVLAIPGIPKDKVESTAGQPLYLQKNIPLLILANYLSGKSSKEKLADILLNIQAGRHYYFTYQVPPGAMPGKYTLISEVISDGEIRHSKTAADDFFFVENVSIGDAHWNENKGSAKIINHSPEPTPVKLVNYSPNFDLTPDDVQVWELGAEEIKEVEFSSAHCFLSYNEERELMPLLKSSPALLRNPYFIPLETPDGNSFHIIDRQSEDAFELAGHVKEIWKNADGLLTRQQLISKGYESVYQEMMDAGILKEISE